MSKTSLKVTKENIINFRSFLKKTGQSFRFRLFLFIFLIYIAGATLDVTNTNPGSRFMLTKSIAKYGEFTIHEEDRSRYSYLDFSILNRFRNPSFEEGLLGNASNWTEFGQNNTRNINSNHTGNYGFQIGTKNGWIEQDISDLGVHSIFMYKVTFWAKKLDISETNLNITVFYADSTKTTHWVRVFSQLFQKYEVNLENITSNKVIDKLRFQNSNSSTVNLDDFHLGSIYSDKPPGLALLTVPIYWFGEIISINLFGIDPSDHFMIDYFVKILIIISILALGAFTIIKFYDLLRIFGVSHRSANWTALVLAFGSLFYVYIGTLFSHSITASFIILAIYFSTKYRLKKEISSLLWTSILSGFVVVCDFILLFLLPFIFCYTFIPFPWKFKDISKNLKYLVKHYCAAFSLYLIPIILCGLLVVFYNFICFNDPFKSPYAYAWYFADNQHFSESMFKGLEILLVSRHHGLFNFMPIVLISIIGLIPMFKKAPALASLCISLSLLIILLYSKYFLASGGLCYGPRQIGSIVPLLIIPLGFIFDLKDEGRILSKLQESIKLTSITIIKSIAIILSGLSFLANFAGSWVGVYPPSQDIIDPIWGSSDYIGHVKVLFSWINFSLNTNGSISLEILQGTTGGFKLDIIFLTLLVELKWPTASSLAIIEPLAFFGVLFLALLINPYFDILNLRGYLSKRVPNILNTTKRDYYIKILTLLQAAVAILFILWGIIEVIRLISSPTYIFLLNFTSNLIVTLFSFHEAVSHIPVVNFLIWIIIFCLTFILRLTILRNSFTLGNWFVNIGLFILVTSITWIVLEQLDHSRRNNYQDNEKVSNLTDSQHFKRYLNIGQILTFIFLITCIWSLFRSLLFSELGYGGELNPTLFTNVTYFILFFVFILTFSITDIIYIDRNEKKDKQKSISVESENIITQTEPSSKFIEIKLKIGLSLMVLCFLIIHVVDSFIASKITLEDFFIIIPALDSRGIIDWFVKVENPVPVYLTLGILLVIIITLVFIYEYLSEIGKVPRTFTKFPNELQNTMKEKFFEISALQSIFIFGIGLLTFIFLLITVLFSVLSTVPNPMLLELHLEEWIIWYSMFIVFIVGILWSINLNKGSNHNEIELGENG